MVKACDADYDNSFFPVAEIRCKTVQGKVDLYPTKSLKIIDINLFFKS